MIHIGLFPNKNMKKQGLSGYKKRQLRRIASGSVVAIAAVFAVATSVLPAHADTIQQQINDLYSQNNQTQSTVSDLQLQANSYQDAINKLQDEINSIQSAINASEAQQAQLQQQIQDNQTKLDQQKKILGEDLKSMYVNGGMTTVEMLATSKDLSQFVDAETYRGAVQSKIQDTLSTIAKLQAQLKSQQDQVTQLLNSQKSQESRLDSDKSQQDNLLAMNQAQQSSYTQQINDNKKKISDLQAQQAKINQQNSRAITVQASGGSGGACDNGNGNGGYPMVWCNATQDTIATIPYSSDPINRECTSFAYWYFTSQEGKSLHVTGNAKDWVYTADRPVDGTPEKGAIAVSTAGPYGHVLIVLATPGQSYGGITAPAGYVITMSMNYDYNGHFIVDERPVSSLSYIH